METLKVNFIDPDHENRLFEISQKHPQIFEKFCRNLLNTNVNMIGEGNAAKVFFIGKNPRYCVKVIKTEMDAGAVQSSIGLEAHIQKRVHNLSRNPFVPKPKMYIEKGESETTELLIMERIFGATIGDVIHGAAHLPEDFDINKFFDQLYECVETLHKNDIHHRDLHEGNVMIDYETNEPKIIDFGAAVDSVGMDDLEIYDLSIAGLGTKKRLSDLSYVKKLKKMLLESLQK
ncbi:MAG TPA: AarF/UbiB family protein [Candidatus Paceibacterota bacterium]|nr:AarF/UbiB family protein [Candidatus Paceibacterota bacterium]